MGIEPTGANLASLLHTLCHPQWYVLSHRQASSDAYDANCSGAFHDFRTKPDIERARGIEPL
jgi:hypothetical protein